ncbi:MAG: pyridoxal phosphate-dependent aminotransferase, partial [Syntrophales bacterium]|nr:pyridoxal phosphate-dependent aminotransferase [Syntrophales bacterium]
MSISKKIRGFMAESSWIRKMFEEGIELKRQFGADNVYDFSLGNPNVAPPDDLKERVRSVAAQEIPGKHAYMPNAGLA